MAGGDDAVARANPNPFALGALSSSLQMSHHHGDDHDDAKDKHYFTSTKDLDHSITAPQYHHHQPHQTAGLAHAYPLGPGPHPDSSHFNSETYGREAFAEQSDVAGVNRVSGHESKKRKRNKPTLSCKECVDKKIKCDRGRPHCLSCIRRGTECVYKLKAEVVEETNIRQPATRRIYPPKSKGSSYQSSTDQDGSPASSNGPRPAIFKHQGGTDLLLSHVPYTLTQSSNIFGIGAEYPWNNYWTQNGGVAEVLKVFPKKEQSDILVNVFFEAVDPVYPIVHRERFFADYKFFWELDEKKRLEVDTDFLGLVFMMLAMGTQFLQAPGSQTELQGEAEFFSSACHQSLRLFSYLNRTSVRAIQSMVLMTYFLLNSGRASDGWAFSGSLIRQAYATGLNREPTLISPQFTVFERLERRRLWHGIVCQDSFMSMSLRLPPAATHSDIDYAAPLLENDDSVYTMGGSPESTGDDPFNGPRVSDPGYVQSMYSLALLAQETISTPRSLSLPVASNPRQRNMLLSRFRACYRSFPDDFRAWDDASIATLVQQGNKRLVRQIMFLFGLYWHCMTLIYSEALDDSYAQSEGGSRSTGPGSLDSFIRGTLVAASESMRAFFVIQSVLGEEGSVWWAFGHRAFSTSIIVASLLKKYTSGPTPGSASDIDCRSASQRRTPGMEPLWERARSDVHHMLKLLQVPASVGDEAARTRIEVLSNYL
ncbi:fungal-specific transcription factor domain-containing protein [Talaromyces proteolyticus]|uniref:Fungal-specific transcription factor domain-containing protein n=1 Tax=Talaromyces proteolyticus TaxID=1131652 RepID=A0AAD4KUX2_9EURO|nr:fungal-specific transcription factor domain-containing protein [Talaromyces proteolyticus]KAH8700441.1 fungal-specific transcription factor domain-containing protein [Talaromyces proteolyticus]